MGKKSDQHGLLATGGREGRQKERSCLPRGPGLSWDLGVDCHEAKRPLSLLTPLETWEQVRPLRPGSRSQRSHL